jgi:hypothetical protein
VSKIDTKIWWHSLQRFSPEIKLYFFALDDPVTYLVCKLGHGHNGYFSHQPSNLGVKFVGLGPGMAEQWGKSSDTLTVLCTISPMAGLPAATGVKNMDDRPPLYTVIMHQWEQITAHMPLLHWIIDRIHVNLCTSSTRNINIKYLLLREDDNKSISSFMNKLLSIAIVHFFLLARTEFWPYFPQLM